MIRRLMLCAPAALMLGGGSVRAEFQMGGQGTAPNAEVAPGEIVDQAAVTRTPIPPRNTGAVPARGFGHQVPLSFAVRQVVPTSVKVSFAEDVDPDTVIVDWQGGRPWPDVLRTLLRRPGLLVTFKPGNILIARPPA